MDFEKAIKAESTTCEVECGFCRRVYNFRMREGDDLNPGPVKVATFMGRKLAECCFKKLEGEFESINLRLSQKKEKIKN